MAGSQNLTGPLVPFQDCGSGGGSVPALTLLGTRGCVGPGGLSLGHPWGRVPVAPPVPARHPGLSTLPTSPEGFSLLSPRGQVRLKGLLSRVSLACLSHQHVALFCTRLLSSDPAVSHCPRAFRLLRKKTRILDGQEASIEHLLYPGQCGRVAPDLRALAPRRSRQSPDKLSEAARVAEL